MRFSTRDARQYKLDKSAAGRNCYAGRQFLKMATTEFARRDSLYRRGWDVKPKERENLDEEMSEIFFNEELGLQADNSIDACNLQANYTRKRKEEKVNAMVARLLDNGWAVSSAREGTYEIPHWEKKEDGKYIVNLKRAYAQQLKFEKMLKELSDQSDEE